MHSMPPRLITLAVAVSLASHASPAPAQLVDAKHWTVDGHGYPLGDIEAPHFGYLMKLIETSLPHCAAAGTGDVNGDGIVDGRDIAGFIDLLLNHSQGPATPVFCAANLQNDLIVDLADLASFISSLLNH